LPLSLEAFEFPANHFEFPVMALATEWRHEEEPYDYRDRDDQPNGQHIDHAPYRKGPAAVILIAKCMPVIELF